MYFIRLLTYTLRFGLLDGILIFIKLQSNRFSKFRIPAFKNEIFVRPYTSDANVFEQIFVHYEYDLEIGYPPQIIVDLGANIGLSALFFSMKFPQAKVIAVEPDKENFSCLKKNTCLLDNVISIHAAVWDKKTEVRISDKYNYGKWGMVVEEVVDKTEPLNRIESITVEEIMKINNIAKIDILKIDIESAEFQLFSSGFELWLPKVKVVLIELHDSMKSGTSKVFFDAITASMHSYRVIPKGENLIVINESI